MSDPRFIVDEKSEQKLSGAVYFEDNKGNKIRPIYQRDIKTGKCSYRVYPHGGHTKDVEQQVHCYKELAKFLIDGVEARCRVPSGQSNNQSINSGQINKLVIEK